MERRQIEEVFVSAAWRERPGADRRAEARDYLFELGKQVKSEPRQWVIIPDAAGLALRNIDHLIPAGSKSAHAPAEVDFYGTKVVKDLPLRKKPFEKGEVLAPQIGSVNWEAVSNAAFVTVPDWPEEQQRKFLQALYFGTYFGDETGLMLNILDP